MGLGKWKRGKKRKGKEKGGWDRTELLYTVFLLRVGSGCVVL